MLIERNRLVSKLNQKALVLLNQRKKLSEALERIKDANLGAIKVLSQAIEAKDPYTRGHCSRVGKLAKAIAENLNYSPKQLKNLELAAFLHDIGKIGIKGAVLNKRGRLTEEEMKHVKLHTVIGENIIKAVEWCRKFIPVIRSHHEMFSGEGYPDGLKADSIPLDARILGIADAFDAMTSKRPYRNALPLDEALRRIKAGSGTQFDPKLVHIFIEKKIYKKDLSSITGISFKTGKGKPKNTQTN
jgi:putative nucleotidyltransferase with HDIG domain